MQQRRLRLGDILDDYCPRERRITNHAVVAMVEDEVKQTRCTTCDADHEYKQARVPATRRRKRGETGPLDGLDGSPAALVASAAAPPVTDEEILPELPEALPETLPEALEDEMTLAGEPEPAAAETEQDEPVVDDDDGPVHRPLIRATLPRPEGQAPERKAPDFTMRQPGGRFDQNRNGQRARGRHPARQPKGPGGPPSRFGQRQGAGHGVTHGQRQGNRTGQPQGGQRGGRPQGPGRGPRPGGGGQGRKRGR